MKTHENLWSAENCNRFLLRIVFNFAATKTLASKTERLQMCIQLIIDSRYSDKST